MLIPIIKDFNNAFSYLISNSVEKTKEVFDPVSKSVLNLSESQSDKSGNLNDILKIGWTSIRICFLFLVQTIQYIVSFQWLRDFAYLPISIPKHIIGSNGSNSFPAEPFIKNFNNSVVSLAGDRQNVLQRFLFSNQTIAKPGIDLAISDQNLPYNNFILGLPNVTHTGVPTNSWSLSFLSNKWFDPLTVPVNFLSTGLDSGSQNISQLHSLPEQITSDLRISNIILMSILICITTGFSSFLNSFFISFPLSLSNLLSLRYLMVQKFWAGCASVLGIVFGEIVFMLFLILPPPFIQITLVYLESVWPYIIGLSLMIFIIFDCISNPYTNTMSLYQSNNQISSATGTSPLTKQTSIFTGSNWTQLVPIKLGTHGTKIFIFSFLLALTEQSCYFSFFGSLNLSSTGNFLDTYLFSASRSPMVLFFSCIGFLIGSFLAITIYNLIVAKAIFLVASLGIKIKQYNPDFIGNWFFSRQTNLKASIESSKNLKSNSILQASPFELVQKGMRSLFQLFEPNKARFIIFRIYTSLKNNIILRSSYLFSFITSKDAFKLLLFRLKNFLQLFIGYLPGGKRIVFFLFPGQARSYKSDFQTKLPPSRLQNLAFNQKRETPLTSTNNPILDDSSFITASKAEPKNSFLSIESTIEKLLRTDSLNMTSSSSASIVSGSKDSLLSNNQSSGNDLQFGGSAFYNKIDKILLTCLITLSFTTIPYYSFDYLVNSFFGFIPQDQILNAHSLRVNFPDYTNLLGITLSDNNSVINTDVSLYDRAHFMYGEWPNSFESLNYQGELMWTNLRDHRRQKRTRRSTRLKFKTLKTKISTSWKEFKRSSGFPGSSDPTAFSEETKYDSNFSGNQSINAQTNNKEPYENSNFKTLATELAGDNSQEYYSSKTDKTIDKGTVSNSFNQPINNNVSKKNTTKAPLVNTNSDKKSDRVFMPGNQTSLMDFQNTAAQKYLRNTNNLSNVFYKIFLASPFKSLNNNASVISKISKNTEAPSSFPAEPSLVKNNDYNQDNGQGKFLSKTFKLTEGREPISQTNNLSKNEMVPKIPEEIRRSTSLSETIKPLSTSTFIDLSGGEKYIKTYPKNWKRVITEKYYQNPIYKTILANDLKNFLKREPLSQQLTNNQENELYFVRIKMAHYYDSLRFYFTLKERINSTRSKTDNVFKSLSENEPSFSKASMIDENTTIFPFNTPRGGKKKILVKSESTNHQKDFEKIYNEKGKPNQSLTQNKSEPIISLSGLKNQTKEGSVFSQKEKTSAGVEASLKSPPFQFKSMSSMNYRQQFKGTLKTVKQLFAISLPQSVSPFSNAQYEHNLDWDKDYNYIYKEPNQPRDSFSGSTRTIQPIEKSYKYDKYLFNEHTYSKNEFLHEEGRGIGNQKPNIPHLRESNSPNSTMSMTNTKKMMSSSETVGSRPYKGIGLATKNIHNMFGSNDPFYVGWDQNLRKFVLTSRILSRSSALNYNSTNSKLNVDQNKKSKPLNDYNHNSMDSSAISDLNSSQSLGSSRPFWNKSDLDKNNRQNLTNQIKNKNNKERLDTSSDIPIYSTNNIKRLQEKKPNFNQQSVHIYRPYTCWPFFKHQLKNLPNRPYFVLYENYLNILNKRIHLFSNININDIDTKSLTFLYSYSFNNNVKKYVSQLPINIYKQSMRPSSLENLFTPTSNARSSFLWPGSTMPAWEYYFW